MATNLQPLASGTAATAAPSGATFTLTIREQSLAHFVLSAGPGSSNAAVEMSVYDLAGNLVFTLVAGAGDTRSTTLFLAAGTYSFRFRTISLDGNAVSPLTFRLMGIDLSDPISTYKFDSTYVAQSPSGGSSGGYRRRSRGWAPSGGTDPVSGRGDRTCWTACKTMQPRGHGDAGGASCQLHRPC